MFLIIRIRTAGHFHWLLIRWPAFAHVVTGWDKAVIGFNRITGVACGTFTMALGVYHTRLWATPDLEIIKQLIVKSPSETWGSGGRKEHVGSEIYRMVP